MVPGRAHNGGMTNLTQDDILEAGLSDWRVVEGELRAHFLTENFATGLGFVNAVGEVAETSDHHPDLTLTYSYVALGLRSHDVGALTERDVDLARRVSAIARERGLASDPAAITHS